MKFPRFSRSPAPVAAPAPAEVSAAAEDRMAAKAVRAALREQQVSSASVSIPSERFRAHGGEWARYYPTRDIMQARRLWNTDSYASEVINNIVSMAAGSGANVMHKSEAWDKAWKAWAWNRSNPNDRPAELFKVAILRLIRDGNILDVKRKAPDDGMPYLRMLNPAYLYGASSLSTGYEGIEIDETGKPLSYRYYPQRSYLGQERPRVYRANEIIHVFKTEWDEPQLMGETWLRKSIRALDELDGLDASMTFSVMRAARTPALYKIPLWMAHAYVRQLDADGNPIDPDDDMAEGGRNQAEADAAKKILERTMGAPGEDGIISDDVDLVSRPFHETMSDPARMLLLQRICRGVGVSVAAALGIFGNGGYLSNRFAVAQDERFYTDCQMLGGRYLERVIEWWQDMMANMSLELMTEPRDYKIDMPVFPMANLQQDVVAMKGLRGEGAVSVQTVARRYGYDPYEEARLMAEWDAMMASVPGESGAEG